jgi:uncharacterized membrane protein
LKSKSGVTTFETAFVPVSIWQFALDFGSRNVVAAAVLLAMGVRVEATARVIVVVVVQVVMLLVMVVVIEDSETHQLLK